MRRSRGGDQRFGGGEIVRRRKLFEFVHEPRPNGLSIEAKRPSNGAHGVAGGGADQIVRALAFGVGESRHPGMLGHNQRRTMFFAANCCWAKAFCAAVAPDAKLTALKRKAPSRRNAEIFAVWPDAVTAG